MRKRREVAPPIVAALAALAVLASPPVVGVAIGHAERDSQLEARPFVGRPAPRLDPGLALGPRSPLAVSGSPALLLFFWAHWCPECKAESPAIAKLFDKYRSRGLAIVAPTKRYGYVEAGRPASPDKELRHIAEVRDTYYAFLQRVPVPVADSNHLAYGVDAIPTNVLIDRRGIIRLYHPGRMTEAELEAAIVDVLER